MTKDREIAEAISDGINCLANLRKIIKMAKLPPPECVFELDAMERAFEAIRSGGVVVTSFVADDSLMADVHGVRGLVSDWLASGRSSPDLVPQIEVLLERCGVKVAYLDRYS